MDDSETVPEFNKPYKMARKIELLELNLLIPYARNARTHSEEQILQIEESIKEFGFNNPILIDSEKGIIAGHGRFLAARNLQLKRVPVVILDHLSDIEKRAYIIADNKLALNAGWDDDILSDEILALSEDDFELEVLGFSDDELSDLLPEISDDPEFDTDTENDVPDIPKNKYNVKKNEVWLLGEHRLLCGDSTDKLVIDRLMNGVKADMVFTDPPYALTGGGPTQKWNKDGTGLGCDQYIDSKRGKLFEVPEFKDWMRFFKFVCIQDSSIFLMSNVRNLKPMMTEIEACGAKIHNILIMDKGQGFPHLWYTCHSEFILYYYFGKAIKPLNKCQPNIFSVKMPTGDNKIHTSQKPVGMIADILNNHPFKNIFDPFLGSGSTLIACEKTKRKCYGMEIDPHYCSVIIERWQEYTGKEATLEK